MPPSFPFSLLGQTSPPRQLLVTLRVLEAVLELFAPPEGGRRVAEHVGNGGARRGGRAGARERQFAGRLLERRLRQEVVEDRFGGGGPAERAVDPRGSGSRRGGRRGSRRGES